MATDNELVTPIEGYTVAVFKVRPDKTHLLMEEDLKLSRAGGGTIMNKDAIIMMIEDAVFTEEQADELRRKEKAR